MPLKIGLVNIPTVIGEGEVKINGVSVDFVKINGIIVWEKKVAAGSQTFTANGTFVVPQGIHEVSICMVGGGGSGASSYSEANWKAGGGYRGALVQQAVAVTPGQSITVVVGAGGAKVTSTTQANGNPGTQTKFGAITANGGAGGVRDSGYDGNYGTFVSSCNGTTYRDGTKAINGNLEGRGGQAGHFGNGGNGGINASGTNGGVGAGGGGIVWNIAGVSSGAGGRGQCVVSWA